MLFSQRKGLKPATKVLQVDSIDQELRNRIWSLFTEHLFGHFQGRSNYPFEPSTEVRGSNLEALLKHYWFALFKQPTDTVPSHFDPTYNALRDYFFKCKWNEAYDFVEFTLKYGPDKYVEMLKYLLNDVLEQENAGYRVSGENIVEITNNEELGALDEALRTPISGARVHIETAVTLMSDRKNPDYRNSIKESISAVESICRAVTGESKATMGDALKLLQSKLGMHPAVKSAFSSLYGYTSDEGGIRHAMMDEPNLSFSDAKFMLLACSAFVNYVVGKTSKAGLKLRA
jgi:hypothetical protein